MLENPPRLSDSYAELFAALLTAASTWNPRKQRDPELVGCWTTCGVRYTSGGLLVLGRATNGGPAFTWSSLATAAGRSAALQIAKRWATTDPLGWVNNPDPTAQTRTGKALGGTTATRSAFWRTTRTVLSLVQAARNGCDTILPQDWAADLAWGNLAKIAPNATTGSEGANPPYSLLVKQRDASIALLEQEIAELNPGVILVIAGSWWAEMFVTSHPGFQLSIRSRPNALYVPQIGTDSAGRRWVFAERPECKPAASFNADLAAALREAGI